MSALDWINSASAETSALSERLSVTT